MVLFILAIIAQLILRNFITEQIYKKSCHDQCDPHGSAADGKPRVPTGGCSEDPGGPGGISRRVCSIRGEISDLIRSDHYIE